MTVRVLDRVAARRPLFDHDGRSGALLERGVLDDGTPVFVKTCAVESDVGQLLTGDARRELRLWRDGVFDALPGGVASAVIGIDDLGDRLVTVTRDLGTAVLSWDSILDGDDVRTIFRGITSMHRAFAGTPPPALCPLETRITVFAPARCNVIAAANPELASAVLRGHELFADLVPADVADTVHRSYDNPAPLAAALTTDTPTTLIHGDFFLVNVAVEDGRVVPLDWGLATAGPAALDLITFCVGAMSNVTLDREHLLAEARAACRDLVDDQAFAACQLWALMELGWNKALDAVDHPDRHKRAAERADLDFWVGRARRALDTAAMPTLVAGDDRDATPPPAANKSHTV
ncbi:MAG: phosphotransferase [Acidimicrobiales bacterium]